jgi:RNA polymerase primary sigma factor
MTHHRAGATDAFAAYLESIRRFPMLARDEECALAARAREGDAEALDALVCANLRFVVSVAKRYQHRGVLLADLVSEGNVGLLRAARRFDESKGCKFVSYAVWWIRQAVLQAIGEQSYLARVPLGQVATLHQVSRETNALSQVLGRSPTRSELARHVKVSDGTLDNALTILRPPVSLEGERFGTRARLDELFADPGVDDPDARVADEALADGVRAVLGTLRAREARVLRLYFGFDGEEPKTLQEIGAILSITRERVRQIKEKALQRLRSGRRSRQLLPWAPAEWSAEAEGRAHEAVVARLTACDLRRGVPAPTVAARRAPHTSARGALSLRPASQFDRSHGGSYANDQAAHAAVVHAARLLEPRRRGGSASGERAADVRQSVPADGVVVRAVDRLGSGGRDQRDGEGAGAHR